MATKPKGDLMITRYYLATGQPIGPDVEPLWFEVPKEPWVRAERAAGFRSHGPEGEPATGGFSNSGTRGSTKTIWTTPSVFRSLKQRSCQNCDQPISLVTEEFYDINAPVEEGERVGITSHVVWRHVHDEFEHGLGPIECDRELVRLVASPAKD